MIQPIEPRLFVGEIFANHKRFPEKVLAAHLRYLWRTPERTAQVVAEIINFSDETRIPIANLHGTVTGLNYDRGIAHDLSDFVEAANHQKIRRDLNQPEARRRERNEEKEPLPTMQQMAERIEAMDRQRQNEARQGREALEAVERHGQHDRVAIGQLREQVVALQNDDAWRDLGVATAIGVSAGTAALIAGGRVYHATSGSSADQKTNYVGSAWKFAKFGVSAGAIPG